MLTSSADISGYSVGNEWFRIRLNMGVPEDYKYTYDYFVRPEYNRNVTKEDIVAMLDRSIESSIKGIGKDQAEYLNKATGYKE